MTTNETLDGIMGDVAVKPGVILIDKLVGDFHGAVTSTHQDKAKYAQMLAILSDFNPRFAPIEVQTEYPESLVLANVVAGIYAPMFHAFSNSILRNVQAGVLPQVVIAPPRDAIPLANSLRAQADAQGVSLRVFEPPVNRNTAGIVNNQKEGFSGRSPHLDLLFDQTVAIMNATAASEVETGIYGTTSLVMAQALKSRSFSHYFPLKFYGLGPNISFVHAVLSKGQEWVAENAEITGLVSRAKIQELMVLLDTMEELGMEKFYKSVEGLEIDRDGLVKPIKVPVSSQDLEVAVVTNQVIRDTAPMYTGITMNEIGTMLTGVSGLLEHSRRGFPFTLAEAIPSMDSQEEHFIKVRKSKLFDYPRLTL